MAYKIKTLLLHLPPSIARYQASQRPPRSILSCLAQRILGSARDSFQLASRTLLYSELLMRSWVNIVHPWRIHVGHVVTCSRKANLLRLILHGLHVLQAGEIPARPWSYWCEITRNLTFQMSGTKSLLKVASNRCEPAPDGQITELNSSCNFPFTYLGQLHYSCIDNVTGVTDGDQLACRTHNWNWAICTPAEGRLQVN